MKWFVKLLNSLFSFVFARPRPPGEKVHSLHESASKQRWEKDLNYDHRDVA